MIGRTRLTIVLGGQISPVPRSLRVLVPSRSFVLQVFMKSYGDWGHSEKNDRKSLV